ncbi:MAG: YHYH protein [Bacteroidia bacterium]|nr:YHYH protein [Bacteroidia bacterium]
MKYLTSLSLLAILGGIILITSCRGGDDPCVETTWYEDSDGDGLGNPDISQDACEQPEGYVADNTDTDDTGGSNSLHPAFSEFDSENFTIYLDGDQVVLESNGLPNHTSPYWSNTTERTLNGPMGDHTTPAAAVDHPLFVAPTATSFDQMAPGNIDDFNGSYTLRVPKSPEKASSSSATGLGPIGMAVSGSMIYNDQEGPNVPLDDAVVSLDYTAAHTGPQSYHYHLEPKAWSDDDEKLIGIMSDGFFIYGRRDYDGNYPTDLDASGGHFGPTPHNPDGEYHYHIQNELFLGQYYIIFPGDLQGTPNEIR